jgi:hypothetical protein
MVDKKTMEVTMNLMTAQIISESMCPYCDMQSDICRASCSSMVIDDYLKTKYCIHEDYDDCPVFLVKKLRKEEA